MKWWMMNEIVDDEDVEVVDKVVVVVDKVVVLGAIVVEIILCPIFMVAFFKFGAA